MTHPGVESFVYAIGMCFFLILFFGGALLLDIVMR
jgi:hypothetical protein